MLEAGLLHDCGRSWELGGYAGAYATKRASQLSAEKPDQLVNDPDTDIGDISTTQSSTTIAVNLDTGVICSSYADSYHYVQGHGFGGVSRSIDGGITFEDLGALDDDAYGHGAMVWRRLDGRFYLAEIHKDGIALYRSEGDCSGFSLYDMVYTGDSLDRPALAIDNNPASPYYNKMYAVFTDFTSTGIYVSSPAHGGWSTPVLVSDLGSVQGGRPAVAPNGDLFIVWTSWDSYPDGPIDYELARSTDGGVSFTRMTEPRSNRVNPRDAAATSSCGRPALKSEIRLTPTAQVAVGPDGAVHVVYSYDPDGYDTGDVIDVFYRRSTDNGDTWGAEVRLNDDATVTDQWNPTLSVGSDNRVVAAWYDRRFDPIQNERFDYVKRVSTDGGTTWQSSERVSDESSPVYVNGDPILAACYHGDFDSQVQDESGRVYLQWSDDRRIQNAHNDPDVWFERDPHSSLIFSDGLESGDTSQWSATTP